MATRRLLQEKLSNAVRIARHFILDRPRLPVGLKDQFGYSPFLVQMVVTRRCNLACGYCNEFDKVSNPLPLDTLKRQLDKIHELGALAVEFTGGEPLLNPDLVEAVRYATELGFPARMMISNAYLFTERRVEQLNEAGLTDLQVSIDGVKTNAMTVKVLDPLRDKLRMISERARFTVTLSAVVGAAPPHEVLEMVDFAREMKFVPRVLLIHGEDGQVKLSAEELAAYEEAKRRIGRRFKESHGYRERLLDGKPAPFKCRSGARYLYLDEFGVVHWCSQQRDDFAKPLMEYTIDDLKEQFDTIKTCCTYCTVGCARTSSAYDEWRPQRKQAPPHQCGINCSGNHH